MCLVTDTVSVGDNYDAFDIVIYTDSGLGTNTRHFSDVGTVTWHNLNRMDAYTLTPYSQTLLLDADYVVASNQLKVLFEEQKRLMSEKHREEKERIKRDIEDLSEEYEKKIDEEKMINEDLRMQFNEKAKELENYFAALQERIADNEMCKEQEFEKEAFNYKTKLSDLQNIISSKTKTIESLQEEIACMFVEKQKTQENYEKLVKELETE